MPNTKSAKKRVKQDERKHAENRSRKTRIKTELSKLDAVVESKDKEKAAEQLKQVFKSLDKAAKTNIIHKNKAARKKGQAARKVGQL